MHETGKSGREATMREEVEKLADSCAKELRAKIDGRIAEMKSDDRSHFLIYRVLGISQYEGESIDAYQNKGRFLYKYAGSFLEEATVLCLKSRFPEGKREHVPNPSGGRPAQFEIDFLNGSDAIEIKWRDATTDGDHITKERARVQAIRGKGFKPIRIMFYYPQRKQATKIQENLKALYAEVGGEYHAGNDAWTFVENYAGIDLKAILDRIADERADANG